MLAKLARIILIGHEAGADFLQLRNNAIDRLREDVTIWLNGNAQVRESFLSRMTCISVPPRAESVCL